MNAPQDHAKGRRALGASAAAYTVTETAR
jgi:hypothetical protein